MVIWYKTEKVVLGNWLNSKNKTEQRQSKVAEEKRKMQSKEMKERKSRKKSGLTDKSKRKRYKEKEFSQCLEYDSTGTSIFIMPL